MKRTFFCSLLIIPLMALPALAQDASTYLRVCSLYGADFFYLPGTGMCIDPTNGDSREQTAAGTFRTFIHPPEGTFTRHLRRTCEPGRVVKLGTFKSTDLTLDPLPVPPDFDGYTYDRKHSVPLKLTLQPNQFVSQVAMSGGFYDPRTKDERSGTNVEAGPCRLDSSTNTYDCAGTTKDVGLCLFSFDTVVHGQGGGGVTYDPYANLPIGCIANTRIRSMPATYVVSATASHPRIYSYFDDAAQTSIVSYVYGTDVVLSTNYGGGATQLTYHDATDGTDKPLAGTVTVSVCVMDGEASFANP